MQEGWIYKVNDKIQDRSIKWKQYNDRMDDDVITEKMLQCMSKTIQDV